MVVELFIVRMDVSMWDNGKMIEDMVMVLCTMLMGINTTKVGGLMVKPKGKKHFTGMMDENMLECLKTMKGMVMESFSIPTEINIVEIRLAINKKEKGYFIIVMEANIKVVTKKIKSMGRASFFMLTD